MIRIISLNIAYPRRAVKRQQEGKVLVAVLVDRSGEVLETTIVKAPDYPLLVKAAKRAISKTKNLPPLPADFLGETMQVSIPISFKLN